MRRASVSTCPCHQSTSHRTSRPAISGDCAGRSTFPRSASSAIQVRALDADGSLVVTWAGYDHLQQARALAGHILDLKENHGWGEGTLIPLLAGLAELLPWLKQWYDEPDPTLGERMGDYFDGFVQDEARAMGVTVAEVQAWRPQALFAVAGGGRNRTVQRLSTVLSSERLENGCYKKDL